MKNVKKDTVVRTALLIVALINMFLNACGKNTLPFTDDEVSAFISDAFVFVMSMISWWKNNSFTPNAIKADEYKQKLKNSERGGDTISLDRFCITHKVGCSYAYQNGFKGECVSLVKLYIRDVLGFTPQSIGNAKEYWLKRNGSYIKAHFKPVSKPKRGDLFVRTSGTYGHIGIVLSAGDTTYYTIEQNKGGCRVVTNELRKYESGYYFLRPLNQENIGADRTLHTPNDEAVYFKAYKGKSDSLVDALEAIGAKTDFAYRKKVAAKNKISNYKGTAEQNTKLLALLKKGKLVKP